MRSSYFAVIDRYTGELILRTLYGSKKDAKLALKNNFNARAWPELAVARATVSSEIVSVTDTSGKWEEEVAD